MCKMGGFCKYILVIYWMMFIGIVVLIGVGILLIYFGFVGFVFKDVIIEVVYVVGIGDYVNCMVFYGFWLIVVVVGLMFFYLWCLIFMIFYGKLWVLVDVMSYVYELLLVMIILLFIFFVGVVLVGMVFYGLFFYDEVSYMVFWGDVLFVFDVNYVLYDMYYVLVWVKVLLFVMMLGGLLVVY